MKRVIMMTAEERKFYDYLIEDSKNWWDCECETFDLLNDNPEYVGKDGMIKHSFDLYTGVWGKWADECIRRYEEDRRDAFTSMLECGVITLRDSDEDEWDEQLEEEAYEEYLKGPNGNFLDFINEDSW